MYVADFDFDATPLMGVEPLPNIRDGIFVKRLVKPNQHDADVVEKAPQESHKFRGSSPSFCSFRD
jgi:hypothetical protein